MNWRERRDFELYRAETDHHYTPQYLVPARPWWQFWKPLAWKWNDGRPY